MDKQEKHEILMVIVVALGVTGMLLAIPLIPVISLANSAGVGLGSFAVVAAIIWDWRSKRSEAIRNGRVNQL